jgi:hypothetical protein
VTVKLNELMWIIGDTLEFYADPRNYKTNEADEVSLIKRDNGSKARVAMQYMKGERVP